MPVKFMFIQVFIFIVLTFSTTTFTSEIISECQPEFIESIHQIINSNTEEEYEASLNSYIDEVLKNLEKNGKKMGLEPLILPNETKEYDYNIWITDIKLTLKLTNGKLMNLTTLQRKGDTKMTYKNNIFRIDGTFEFPELQFQYDFATQLDNFGPKGKIYGSIHSLKIHIPLEVNANKIGVSLPIGFPEVGKIVLKVDMPSIFSTFINAITWFVTNILKDPILLIVQLEIKHKIKDLLNTLILENCSG